MKKTVKALINEILYPSESEIEIKISDAFGNIIGFEIYNKEVQTKTEDEYEDCLQEKIIDMVELKISTIEVYITSNNWAH